MDENYIDIRKKAQEILETYKAPKRKESYISQMVVSIFAALGFVVIGLWQRNIAALGASVIFFILFIVFIILACIHDADQNTGEIELDRFKKSILVPSLLNIMLPECVVKTNESEGLALASKLCGHKADTYYDYGTFHFTMRNGSRAVFTRVWAFSYDHTDHTSREQAVGSLFCFPGVLSNGFDEPVYVFYNKEEYIKECNRRAGINRSFSNMGLNLISSLAQGDLNKHHIRVSDKKFSQYYNAFAGDKASGERFLTEDRVQKLIALHETFDKWFSVSCVGTDVFVFVKDDRDFVNGVYSAPKIVDENFEKFYRVITESGMILDLVAG